MIEVVRAISVIAIPAFIFFVLGYGHIKKINVYETFIEGAKEGLATVVRIFPYMVAMFVAIGIFRSSGAMGIFVKLLLPLTRLLGIPGDMLPLALMRPISGIASSGMLAELFKTHSPDSFIGRAASTMMGSTETIFYTLSIYFGAVGIKKIRYTLWGALLADLAGLIASIVVCTIVFGR
ncbi:MAG TPA: nucleoside recognition domain-containing protein [Clostridia bacterium]|nr:nucleoside recognition domain-containing protein [Clostridia bacterium]